MFPLPRIIYAMASDGLIFKFLSKVHPKFHTPFMGTVIAGTIAGKDVLNHENVTDTKTLNSFSDTIHSLFNYHAAESIAH